MGRPDESQSETNTVIHEMPLPPSTVPRQKKPPSLEQIAGVGAPRNFLLELPETVIGRSLQANISIEGTGMSRQHATLKREGVEFSVLDLGSSNGIYLNGVKAHSAVLHDGDQIQLGDVVLVFREGA